MFSPHKPLHGSGTYVPYVHSNAKPCPDVVDTLKAASGISKFLVWWLFIHLQNTFYLELCWNKGIYVLKADNIYTKQEEKHPLAYIRVQILVLGHKGSLLFKLNMWFQYLWFPVFHSRFKKHPFKYLPPSWLLNQILLLVFKTYTFIN